LQTTLLFLAVWWVWVYTSWITNWLNPERTPVRLLLFVLMFGGLVISTSIPKAFESRGLWFAMAYAAMQVGRTVFLLLSTSPDQTLARMNAVRILVWLLTSAILWIAGGFAEGHWRLVLWAVALGSNIPRRRCGSGSRNTAPLRSRTGSSRVAISPSAAPASSSSRLANPSS
jgi:low temperature requirement protein LtrA